MNSKITLLALAVGLTAGLAACGDIERGKPTPVVKKTEAPGPVTGNTGGDGGGAVASSFAADVHPILMDKCSGCHTPTNGTPYKLTGDAATDYPVVKALVNTGDPAGSLLVQKCTASVSHGGGKACGDVGGDTYNTILKWITDGAQP